MEVVKCIQVYAVESRRWVQWLEEILDRINTIRMSYLVEKAWKTRIYIYIYKDEKWITRHLDIL